MIPLLAQKLVYSCLIPDLSNFLSKEWAVVSVISTSSVTISTFEDPASRSFCLSILEASWLVQLILVLILYHPAYQLVLN